VERAQMARKKKDEQFAAWEKVRNGGEPGRTVKLFCPINWTSIYS
jgi:hypothetical protein